MAADERPEEQLILLELPARDDASEPEVKPLPYPIWTERKARLIERYLFYFVLITKHGTYIDGFAGPQREDQPDMWAARLVLETRPRWFRHFYFYDDDAEQVRRLKTLRHFDRVLATESGEEQRDVRVYHGDFNAEVHKLLASGQIGEKEATFCLLDQRTFECHWSTVEALAAHKRQSRKIEIFYFLPQAWLDRALSAQRDFVVIHRWWGRDDWSQLRDIGPHERAQMMVERFKNDLGYRSAKAWPIYGRSDGGGPVMYHMIHATDHPDAPDLMRRAYVAAVTEPPKEQLRLDFVSAENFDVRQAAVRVRPSSGRGPVE
jgi:three-Cys-motif partner protein